MASATSGRIQWSRIFFEVFLADVDAELVENFDHVVVRNWGFGVVVRVIPGKWMNQYTNQNFGN
jgi:hypothetical protein